MVSRLAYLVIAVVAMLAACGGSEDAAVDAISPGGEATSIAPTALAVDTLPATDTAEPVAQIDEPDDDLPAVPFPPPQNLSAFEQAEPLVLGRPPSLFDFYDDIVLAEDFAVYEDERGRVTMTEVFVKEGLTYGYVTWTVDGVTQSTSSPASNELATCAADVLAASMDRFDAELIARGVNETGAAEGREELIDLYIECGGTDELLTSFRDDLRLDPSERFDSACIEATVTTEEHIRIVSGVTEDVLHDYTNLVGPCFNWSVIPVELEEASLMCLESRSIDALRSSFTDDASGLLAILEACLTPEEFAEVSE